MRLGPSIRRHVTAAAIAVAAAVTAAVIATATSDNAVLVMLVWMAVAWLTTTKALTLTHAVMDYRRARRLGQEHLRWLTTVADNRPHMVDVD